MDNGNANGTTLNEKRTSSFRIKLNSKPFPTKSSIYFQRNCIKNMNSEMKNVNITGQINEKKTTLSTFFNAVFFALKRNYKKILCHRSSDISNQKNYENKGIKSLGSLLSNKSLLHITNITYVVFLYFYKLV
jgi:hypothetical protein